MKLSVDGAKIYVTLNIPGLGPINIVTQTTITLLVTTLLLIWAAWALTRKIQKRPAGPQVIVEKLVTMLYGLVGDTMGKHNLKYAPYIGTLFLSSFTGSLLGMTGILRSSTADLSVTIAWALVTTGLVWYNSIKANGFLGWLKGFTEPVVVMTPMNIVSEIAQPISMGFRHFGNVAGGSVLTSLIYGALAAASSLLFGWMEESVAACMPPIFQAGIPAVLSIYFDLFSGFVQAFVFCLLTMVYVGSASPPPVEDENKSTEEASEALPEAN